MPQSSAAEKVSSRNSRPNATRAPAKPAKVAEPVKPARPAPKMDTLARAVKRPGPFVPGNPGFVVRRSTIQGRGVFASRSIAEGELIVEYLGKPLTHEAASALYDDETVSRHHTFLFTVDDELCIDGGRRGNEARFINHSCEPNAIAEIEERRIFISSLRPIEEGEEILYDYWYSTDETYTLEDLRRIYPCRCGSAKCRGTIAAPPKKPRAKAVAGATKTGKARKAKRNGSR